MNPERGDAQDQATIRHWHQVALALVIGTLAYNLIEAAVALHEGLGKSRLHSLLESVAAAVLLWRLSHGVGNASKQQLADMDRRVTRVVGVTFLVLALYILAQSAWTLVGRVRPEESTVGIVLAVASVIVMPLVSW